MKTVSITGHTAGIGKAVFDLLSKSYDCKGYSRSNGYDITINLDKIVEESKNSDIFINNVYHETQQQLLFERLLSIWRRQENKTIVNMNSRAHYLLESSAGYKKSKHNFWESSRINMFNRKCKVVNICPGFVHTDNLSSWIKQTNTSSITEEQCANYIKWAIEQPIEIYELSFWKL